MPVTTSNLLVGAGILQVGNYGAADYDMRDVGGTRDGVEISRDTSYLDISSDQHRGTIAKVETNRKFTIKTTLLESTLANLAMAWGFAMTAVTSGTFKLGTPAATEYKRLRFIGGAPGTGQRRKATFWKCVSIGTGGHSYKKDGETLIPVEFEVIVDTTQATDTQYGQIVDAVADTTPPTVTASVPANNATGVAVGANLTVTFSESVDAWSASQGFTIEKVSDGSVVVNPSSATVTYNDTTKVMTIDPTANLAAATQYRLRVRNVADLEGNRLAADYIATFTTA